VEIADEKSIELYRNGHVELRVQIIEEQFFSRVKGDEGVSPLFVPWPLGEYPLSLFRLSKAIYAHLGLTDPVVVSLSLYNISGFKLWPNINDPRNPRFLGNRMKSLARAWRKPHLEIQRTEVSSLEVPEQVAREMADRIWQAFGHEQTPLFDDSGN